VKSTASNIPSVEPSSEPSPKSTTGSNRGPVHPKVTGREVIITAPPTSVILDTKTSSSQAVEDALDALISSTPAEAAPPARTVSTIDNKKNNKKKGKDRNYNTVDSLIAGAKESSSNAEASNPATIDNTTATTEKDMEYTSHQSMYKNKRKGKQYNTGQSSQPAFQAPSQPASASAAASIENPDSKGEKSGKTFKTNDKNYSNKDTNMTSNKDIEKEKEKEAEKDSVAPSLMVIPPAPVLVVPPPPSKPDRNDRNDRGKKHDKRNENKQAANTSNATFVGTKSEQSNSSLVRPKDSMLVKINNPFLEQQAKKASVEKEPVASELPAPSRSAGPPKVPPQLVTLTNVNTTTKPSGAENSMDAMANKEPLEDTSSSAQQEGGRHRNRNINNNFNRRRKDHADLLNEVKIISVETADKELAVSLSTVNIDSAKTTSVNKALGKKTDKDSPDSSIPSSSSSSNAITASEPTATVDYSEPPLPARTKKGGPPSKALALGPSLSSAAASSSVTPSAPPGLPPSTS
jgi:hypothetical protein